MLSDTRGFSKTCDPNFTLIGHKLFIFPSPTWFRKISLRSEVKQVPLSYQLRSEIKDLGTTSIVFTELLCSSLVHPFLVPSASPWLKYLMNKKKLISMAMEEMHIFLYCVQGVFMTKLRDLRKHFVDRVIVLQLHNPSVPSPAIILSSVQKKPYKLDSQGNLILT